MRSALHGSLRFRLLLGTLLWIAATIALSGWGLAALFSEHIREQFYSELTTHLDQLTAQLAVDAPTKPQLTMPLSDPRFKRPLSGLYWQIDKIATAQNEAEVALLRSRSLWDQLLEVPSDTPADGELHYHRVTAPQGGVLGMVERQVRLDDLSLRLIVAADEALWLEPLGHFRGQLWLALALLGMGLAVAALVQVVVGLAPLRTLQASLAQVRIGATPQLEGRFPSEIMPLVEEFNHVLRQNSEVVSRARTHAGNLAHALKTPLTVLANAAHSAANAESELAALVATQVELARRQVDYHLTRAQAAATRRLPGARTLVQPVIAGLLRTMQRLYAARELTFLFSEIPATLAFRGEEQDLQEILGNLLDNGCKWAQHTVAIEVSVVQQQICLKIGDDGPGVDSAQRQAVFRRGVRVDEQIPGSGLGLAIVDDLVTLYGGTLQLSDSPLGGLEVTLLLPLADSDATLAGR
ncbi:MAG: sensor histidine kinase [Gammaproteobacteria bacterium]|nr:sensor histidine kinase [Gammaproteobacteria bacterium]